MALTRAWLDNNGFTGLFIDWTADALVGKSNEWIMGKFGQTPAQQDKAEQLVGLLATAKLLKYNPTGKKHFLPNFPF